MNRFLLAACLALAASPAFSQSPLSETATWATVLGSRVQLTPDVHYLTAGSWEGRLDVFRPRNVQAPTPVLVWIHGGGWMGGDKETFFLRALPFLQLDWAVVNVEYRLGRTALAPAAVQDCRCALRWVFQHAAEYHFDPGRVVVGGSSSGAHLALMTGMLSSEAGLDDLCPGDSEVRVAAIINQSGITDVNELLEGANRRWWAVAWLGGQRDRARIARRVSPLTYVRPGLPPVITIHGDADPTVPYQQAVRLHQALTKAGVPNRLVTVPHGGHGYTDGEEVPVQTAIREFLLQQKLITESQVRLSSTALWATTLGVRVRSSTHLPYLTAGGWEGKLDVYRPRAAAGATPVVLWIHGGGWVNFQSATEVLEVLPYLQLGWAVVNVDYRLAKVAPAPAAVQDCRCALRWVVKHAAEYKFDPGRIIVAGGSAGGHLALMTGMLTSEAGFDDLCPGDGEVPVAAIINQSGITDVNDLLKGENRRWWAVKWLAGQPGSEELARSLSPLQYVRPGLPAIITIHGDADPTVPYNHAVRLHEALVKAGVSSRLITLPGGKHGYTEAEKLRAQQAIREFLAEQPGQKFQVGRAGPAETTSSRYDPVNGVGATKNVFSACSRTR